MTGSPADRERLRRTFDAAAERYDRARPGYPGTMFDDLAARAALGPGARVLELGAGTGKATVPLAQRGYAVVAIELGERLAAVARRNLAAYPQAEVVCAAFEDWPLPPAPFDAVVAATAFAWIDPAVRVTRSAAALRPGGSLATVGTHHVAGGTEAFFEEVQACYERWDPATPPGLRLAPPEAIPQDSAELDASGLFEPAQFRRYLWVAGYSTAAYVDLLLTYSGHLALPEAARAGLLADIARLIDTRYGGRIEKRYLTELRLARRR
jgi:SAM-dependent methyltransferase